MKIRPSFWKAFLMGLASPVMLFGQTPDYRVPSRNFSPSYSFAHVGAMLTQMLRRAKLDEKA